MLKEVQWWKQPAKILNIFSFEDAWPWVHRSNCQKSDCAKKIVFSLFSTSCIWENKQTKNPQTPKSYHVQKRNFVSSCQKFPTWSHWGRWGPPEPINSPRGELCLLFSYNPSEMGKEQNMGKGNCFNIPLLLVSFFGHHMTMRYDSCGQNVDTFALKYATRSCMYLRSHGYKPNLLVLQTRTNTGTGWTNPGKDCQKVIDFPFLDKLKIQLNKALSNFI